MIRKTGYGDDGTRFWGNVPPAPACTRRRDTDWWLGRTFEALGRTWRVVEIDGQAATLQTRGAVAQTTLNALNASLMRGDLS